MYIINIRIDLCHHFVGSLRGMVEIPIKEYIIKRESSLQYFINVGIFIGCLHLRPAVGRGVRAQIQTACAL